MRLVGLILLSLACCAAASAGLIDSIDVADPASVAAHSVKTHGNVESAIAGDRVGGHDLRRLAHILTGEDAAVSYSLRVEPGKPITLEFEELDGRETDVRAYVVVVDDVPTEFRTWQSCGAGPVHFFVAVSPRAADRLTVKLVNRLATPIRISRVWAFSDFETYFDDAKMAVSYCIAPTVKLSMDFDADLVKLDTIRKSLGDHPEVQPAWTAAIGYAKLDDARVARRMDYILRLAAASKMPLQLCFDTWWARTPSAPWNDDRYQQWVWNATRGAMQRSIPNRWSNCPWLTVNDPDLNAFKVVRMKQAVSTLRLRLREQPELRDSILSINLDNEPVYWASGNAGLGPDTLEGDFNPRAIETAKKDGITLDPTDGLSTPERRWLFQNLLNYNTLIAQAMVDALGRDASIVTRDGAVPADDLLANNVYTQAMTAHPRLQYPMFDGAWPLWESAAPAAARCGGEWNEDSLPEQQAVMHHVALGRSAATNAECSNKAENCSGVRVGYALGERYYTPYNYPLDKMDVATAGLRDGNEPFATFVHQPALLEHGFADEKWERIVAEYGGVETGAIGNNPTTAVYPTSVKESGFLLYRLRAPGGTFTTLSVELFGRAFDYHKGGSATSIRVLVDGREMGRISGKGDINAVHRIDLGDAARGKETLDVRIELDAGGAEMRQWCCLWQVRFTSGWPEDLRTLVQKATVATTRKRNLLTSWRRDAELALARASTPAAKEAYARGDYALSYRLANQAVCVALPAQFDVRESGPLSPYPLRVETDSPVQIELREVSGDRIRLSASKKVRVLTASMPVGRRYAITRAAAGDEWIVSPSESGALIANDAGQLTFEAGSP